MEKDVDILGKYRGISNKLKKRFLKRPNVAEGSEQYGALARSLKQQDCPQYAAFCCLAQARVLQPGDKSEQSAGTVHIFSTNKEVDRHNISELENLGQEVHVIQAVDTVTKKGKQYRRAEPLQKIISAHQTELRLAVGARVMLSVNLDVADGLVNGAVGEICSISSQKNTMGFPTFIAVLFDHPNVGANSRRRTPLAPGLQSEAVLIEPFGVKEHYGKMDVTRHQFPLRLAWACTIHKVQGQTFKAAVVSLKTVFLPGMAYVAVSRVTSLDGLHLLDYNPDNIYADNTVQKAMDGMEPIAAIKENKIQKGSESFLIVHHNIQSLQSHFPDMKANADLRNADIICLTETWLPESFSLTDYTLQGYNMVHDHIYQKGRGICMYLKEHVVYQLLPCHNVNNIEMFSITFQDKAQRILLATLYRPPQHPVTDLKEVPVFLCETAAKVNADAIILIGDFNKDFNKKEKKIMPSERHIIDVREKQKTCERPHNEVRKNQERKARKRKQEIQDDQVIRPKRRFSLRSEQKQDQPTSSLCVVPLFAIPNDLPATDKIRIARVVDMWGVSHCVYELCEWLEKIGFHVLRDISRRQRGSTCGYIAARVAWLLHISNNWLDENVTLVGSLQEELVREYNSILGINSQTEICLSTDQILQLLSTFQREAQEGTQMNWIDGPMAINYFTKSVISFILEPSLQRVQPKIVIINTTPVYGVVANFLQEEMSGDHWIVIAYNII